jgi:hypothetical protein
MLVMETAMKNKLVKLEKRKINFREVSNHTLNIKIYGMKEISIRYQGK